MQPQVLVLRDEKATPVPPRGYIRELRQSEPIPNPTPSPNWTPSKSLKRALTVSSSSRCLSWTYLSYR